MRHFRPPPGATRTHAPKAPGNVGIPFGEFAHDTRFWRVPAKPAAVVAFLQAHDVPAGFTAHCGSNNDSGSAQCELENGSRRLEYGLRRTVAGTSILRVDAQVVWVYPRSPKESVPASRVREIDFSAPNVSKQVTDRLTILRIVRWFNRMPIEPPGMGSSPGCGLAETTPVTLEFRAAGGKVLAHVSAVVTEPEGGVSFCDPMRVRIHGTPQPALTSPDFFGRVQRAIGVTVG